jgi:hypothetical protein
MNKYEKLIEFIINEDEEKARDLFHQIVVEKSKSIYESLMDDEVSESPEMSDDEVGDLANDVEADEEGVNEEGEEDEASLDDLGDEDLGDEEMDMDMDMDMDAEEGGDDEPATKGDVMDLEDAIEELKAEFDKIMGTVDADGDGDHDMDDHEAAEEAVQFEAEEAEEDDEEVVEAEEVDLDEDEEEIDEAAADAELAKLREYVEKVAGVSNTEGADNKSSVVAGKNDMGGSAGNIVAGGEETGGKAAAPKKDDAGNINVPGGKASKLAAAPKPKSAE